MSYEYSAAARAHASRMLGNSSHSRGADEVFDLVADAYDKGREDRDDSSPTPDYIAQASAAIDRATYPSFNEDIDLNPLTAKDPS